MWQSISKASKRSGKKSGKKGGKKGGKKCKGPSKRLRKRSVLQHAKSMHAGDVIEAPVSVSKKGKKSLKRKGHKKRPAPPAASEPIPFEETPPASKAAKSNRKKAVKPASVATDVPEKAKDATKAPKAKAGPKKTAKTKVPADPAVTQELLTIVWDYAGCEYDLTGCDLHVQKFSGLRLNVYWSRDHVGIDDKTAKRDIVNFTSPTETIITHLHLANLVATYLNYDGHGCMSLIDV